MSRPHEDLVLRARIRLLSSDLWPPEGEEAMRVYRVLFAVSPRAYAYRLAATLLDLGRDRRSRLPRAARRALLTEALEAVAHVPAGGPWYEERIGEWVRGALAQLDAQESRQARGEQEMT
ncbi:hypothetical protein ABTZ03_36465 [Kitasatospora sp. NPDC096077]|uniref:hypothetical protein n=1 Tax=Kitasatospora sp. NPDC096077 TaxID=3155544 RepID=UPI00332A2FF7